MKYSVVLCSLALCVCASIARYPSSASHNTSRIHHSNNASIDRVMSLLKREDDDEDWADIEDLSSVLQSPDQDSWSGAAQTDDNITAVSSVLTVPVTFHCYKQTDGFCGGQAWIGVDAYSKCKLSARTGVAWQVSKKHKFPKLVAFVDVGLKRVHEFNMPISPADVIEFQVYSLGIADVKIAINNKSMKLSSEISLQTVIGYAICDRLDRLPNGPKAVLKKYGKKHDLDLEKPYDIVCGQAMDLCFGSVEWMVSKLEAKVKHGKRKLLPMAKYKDLKFKKMSYSQGGKQHKLSKPKIFKHEEGIFKKDVSTCKVRGGNQMKCRYGKLGGLLN